MPWWASDASPGRGGEPPPTSAAAEAVWCGARSTRSPQRAALNAPATLRIAADSSASSCDSGGSRPARRRASIDLPVPGGPTMSRLSWPAAATSSARLAAPWPRTSTQVVQRRRGARARSGRGSRSAARVGAIAGQERAHDVEQVVGAAHREAADQRRLVGARLRQDQRARASRAGARCRASAIASAPCTGRSWPPSESSPANSNASSRAASIWPAAARMPSAIGRSKRPDSFGRSAGARLTVTRLLCGNSRPLVCSAARTRSRDSLTSVSARPTSVKLGRPLARWTSTVTAGASRPRRARLWTRAKLMAGDSRRRAAARRVRPKAGTPTRRRALRLVPKARARRAAPRSVAGARCADAALGTQRAKRGGDLNNRSGRSHDEDAH